MSPGWSRVPGSSHTQMLTEPVRSATFTVLTSWSSLVLLGRPVVNEKDTICILNSRGSDTNLLREQWQVDWHSSGPASSRESKSADSAPLARGKGCRLCRAVVINSDNWRLVTENIKILSVSPNPQIMSIRRSIAYLPFNAIHFKFVSKRSISR